MYITLETDYAIRIVDCLARHPGRQGAKSIAEQSSVTLRFSLKILRKLVASGIIKSYKGTQGGYEMAMPLEEVSVYDILKAIEGDYTFSRCGREDVGCNRGAESYCAYHYLFEHISHQVVAQLSAMTMDKILAFKSPEHEATFQNALKEV